MPGVNISDGIRKYRAHGTTEKHLLMPNQRCYRRRLPEQIMHLPFRCSGSIFCEIKSSIRLITCKIVMGSQLHLLSWFGSKQAALTLYEVHF